MRLLLTVALVPWLASSCASRGPSAPPARQTVAPTVTTLGDVPRPTLDRANPLVARQGKDLAKVKNENAALQRTVEQSKNANHVLSSLLDRSLVEGQADKTRLEEINVLVQEERTLTLELTRLVDTQKKTIGSLETTTDNLRVELGSLSQEIAVSNQRLKDTTTQVTTANERIVLLTQKNEEAILNAQDWKSAADQAQGKIDTEARWKWRFFWWGVVASSLIAVYLFVKLRSATREFAPLLPGWPF